MLTPQETKKIESYLRGKFGKNFIIKIRKEDKSSAEVLLGDEFLGTIYRDEDEGEVSYDFNMAILAIDLPQAA